MTPLYLQAYENGKLGRLIEQAHELLRSCSICPRRCGVNRLDDERGFCNASSQARIYSYMAHQGEEPPVSGSRGSGAIFFAQCNLRCAYCQNHAFSQHEAGRAVNAEELAQIMLALQREGCHNINLVTPTHIMPQIIAALEPAIAKGLRIPLVYNTSGYELASIIALLDNIIDIYLTDMRYGAASEALAYSTAPEYPAYNQEAVIEMYRQVGLPQMDDDGIIRRGLIVRHLVLPDGISGTPEVMRFLGEKLSRDTFVSLMSQYTPYYRAAEYPRLNRRLSVSEYAAAHKTMQESGLANGWTQEAGGLEQLAGIHIKPK